ncbi:pyridoxal phosphate-dependent decarboxylase family protein [Rhodoblastus sp.]|uniref:pyridoxal phosphate-dependent decarboxylase family protein n=1 Tax=Rhodoblastus sp. TaxID=1962975 RepID=UPI003F9D5833
MTESPHSLDPEDWEAFRALSHQALDAMIDDLASLRQRPVWVETAEEIRRRLNVSAPREKIGFSAALGEFYQSIQPYVVGNRHPAFFGWAHGAGTPAGMVAEMLAAGLNANCGGRNHVGIELERRVAAWMAEAFSFPAKASGLFVGGTSLANFLGVLIARHACLGESVRRDGVGGEKLRAYASTQAHGCVAQAMDMAGLGTEALRKIACDAQGRIDMAALKAQVVADRAAGEKPFLIVASAGTVNFGAIDPLALLADFAGEQQLWLHVDGAFGALAVFSDQLKPLLAGIERADSIAFDFHKWGHVPYDAGFILVRDGEAQRRSFAAPASYLTRAEAGLAKGEIWPCDLGPDLSRGFRALKVWMTLQTCGTRALGEAMEANCAAARRLAALIEASRDFYLVAPVPLNIVCFSLSGENGDAANRRLVETLHVRGLAAPSITLIDGRAAIRCAIFNHRTTMDDIDLFFAQASELAAELRN